MQFLDDGCIQIYRENGVEIFYNFSDNLYYKAGTKQVKKPGVSYYILISISLYIGYVLNPYWHRLTVEFPYLKYCFGLLGAILIVVSFIWGRMKLDSQFKIKATPIDKEWQKVFVTTEKIMMGINWFHTQLKIAIGCACFIVILNVAFFLSNHIMLGILIALIMLSMGLMLAIIRPLKRRKFYKEWLSAN